MNASLLTVLQGEQQRHDELAHRDILALPFERRITHMSLHYAKYAGRLLELRETDATAVGRIVVDISIITLACANILNTELDSALGRMPWHSEYFSRCEETLHTWIGTRLAIFNSRIAKACEAFDHREDLPYRQIF